MKALQNGDEHLIQKSDLWTQGAAQNTVIVAVEGGSQLLSTNWSGLAHSGAGKGKMRGGRGKHKASDSLLIDWDRFNNDLEQSAI